MKTDNSKTTSAADQTVHNNADTASSPERQPWEAPDFESTDIGLTANVFTGGSGDTTTTGS